MDFADIKRQAEAARQFPADPQAGGRVSATLRIPTRHEVQLELRRAGGDAASPTLVERALIEQYLTAWAGVRIRDVLPEHPNDDPLDHSREAVALLLDAQPDWAAAWSVQLFQRMRQQREQQEAAEKNS